MSPALHPINSVKNIVETSGILPATTNTVIQTIVTAVEPSAVALSDLDGIAKGSKVNGIFLSLFFTSEGGELATEVPLLNWYIIKDQGNNMATAGFAVNGLPTPGGQGAHENKRFVLHSEQGLTGGGDASLSGVPMVFKGVIVIPKGMRGFRINDTVHICARSNFNTKFCLQAIYKWYS